MKKTVFIKNAAVLTATTLALRLCGILFKIWLADRLGAEGMGLYTLIFSVFLFASAFASTGICTAVTRLVSEELCMGCRKGITCVFARGVGLSLAVGFAVGGILFAGAAPIARFALGDLRAGPALRMMALSLPPMALCSCFRGYFLARRRATPSSVSLLLEQGARIALSVGMLMRFRSAPLSVQCGAILGADAVAQGISALFLGLCYGRDSARLHTLCGRAMPPYRVLRRIFTIAGPLTAGRYAATALRTLESLLVPRCLQQSSAGESALAQFGQVKGMALPILLFPATLLSGLSLLLLPEISAAAAQKHRGVVRETVRRALRLTTVLGVLCGSIFFYLGPSVGRLLYHSDAVGHLLFLLSPLVPLMYLDSICDGILKGLDQQRFSFFVGVADGGLRLILVLLLVPKYGLAGFVGVMYFSNLFTPALCLSRLLKLTDLRPAWLQGVVLPTAAAFCVGGFVTAVLHGILRRTFIYTALSVALIAGICLPLLFGFGSLRREDF